LTGRIAAAALIVLATSACDRPPSVEPFVVVLGTAQDGGLPHAACTCPRCEAARRDPGRRRLVASIAIVVPSAGKRYLVDATPDLREQLDRIPAVGSHPRGSVDRAPVDGVLLTHAHIGHYLGLAFFGFEAIHTTRLPVWATPRMAAFLGANAPWSRLVTREEIALHETPPGVAFELDTGVRVTPFAVPHRDEDSDTVAYEIAGPRHTVFYAPDTDAWDTWSGEAVAALGRCDAALIDGTFFAAGELPGRDVAKIGHPLIPATMDLLEDRVRSGRLRVLFTHINHSNPLLEPASPERRAVEDRGFSLADEGRRLPL
jgi:pyrroloquinoline quinone biosynthesis protein B